MAPPPAPRSAEIGSVTEEKKIGQNAHEKSEVSQPVRNKICKNQEQN